MDICPNVESKPSIAVVDDDDAVLRSVTRLLSVHGFDATGYSSPEQLLAALGDAAPDCIVADLAMPGINGFDLQRSLAGLETEYPLVFITGFGDIRTSVEAMKNGAVDFLAKPVDQSELIDAVGRAIARGRRAREQAGRLEKYRHRFNSLTSREREVFVLVVAGRLNKQIAATLGIAEKTVKVHRARVMRKMSVRSVAGLARVAERIGIETPLR